MRTRFFSLILALFAVLLPQAAWAQGTIEYTVTDYDGLYDGQAHGISVNVTSPANATVTYGTSYKGCTSASSPTYTNKGTYRVFFKIEAEGYTTVMGGIGTVNIATDPTAYVELALNNNAASFDADDATYDLTFKYDANATTKPADTDTKRYFYLNSGELPGCWSGYRHENDQIQWLRTQPLSAYVYSPKVTTATLENAFIGNASPTATSFWFAGCRKLTNITGIENLNTSTCMIFTNMFIECESLTSLDLSAWDTSKAQLMSGMFRACRNLAFLDVSKFNMSNVRIIDMMFAFCNSLTSLNLKKWDVSNIISIQSCFQNMISLKELDLSTWNLSSLTSYRGIFSGLSSLKTLDISNISLTNTSNISLMFQNCPNLKTIYVGENWIAENINSKNVRYHTESKIYEGGAVAAFDGCPSLVGGSGTTYQTYYNELSAAGGLYKNANTTENLEKAIINSNISKAYARPDGGPSAPGLLTSTKAFAVVYDDGAGNKTLYLCNRGASEVKTTSFKPAVAEGEAEVEYTSDLTVIDNLSTMGDNKWNLHALLTEAGVDVAEIDRVVIEKTFAYMRPTTCESWFSGMSNATFEGLENLNTTECTSMKDMFRGTSISSLDFSTADLKLTFKTSKVTDMSGMFADMTNLTSVTFASNFSTANVTNMENMFSGCSSLTDISSFLEYANTTKVTDMSGMFNGCESLKGNTKDKKGADMLDLANINTANVTDMANMFNGCESLLQLNLASFDTRKVTDMAGMFNGCSALVTIYANIYWDTDAVSNPTAEMFADCVNLEGSNDTRYSPSNENDVTYAHIDGGSSDPGYLTESGFACTFWGDDAHDNNATLQTYNGLTATVTVNRDFAAGEWTTLCLPFDMTAKQVTATFGSGVALKTISGVTRSGDTATGLTLTSASAIEAGKPYFIKPSQAVTTFTLSHKTVKAAAGSVTKSGFSMRGALSATTLSPASSGINYTLADELTAEPSAISGNYTAIAKATSLGGLQAYFVDMKVSDVVMTVSNAGVSVKYLPYAVAIPDVDFFVPCILKNVESFVANNWTGTGYLAKIKGDVIPAYTPFIVFANQGSYTLAATDDPVLTAEEENFFASNILTGVSGTAAERKVSYLQEDGKYSVFVLARGTTEAIGFKLITNGNTTIPDNYVALRLEGTVGANTRLSFINLSFGGEADDSEVTAIKSIISDTAGNDGSGDGIYYNLNGQRVTAPTKGIYIKDGKKIYVK